MMASVARANDTLLRAISGRATSRLAWSGLSVPWMGSQARYDRASHCECRIDLLIRVHSRMRALTTEHDREQCSHSIDRVRTSQSTDSAN